MLVSCFAYHSYSHPGSRESEKCPMAKHERPGLVVPRRVEVRSTRGWADGLLNTLEPRIYGTGLQHNVQSLATGPLSRFDRVSCDTHGLSKSAPLPNSPVLDRIEAEALTDTNAGSFSQLRCACIWRARFSQVFQLRLILAYVSFFPLLPTQTAQISMGRDRKNMGTMRA
jgi:hypothetical protein